MSKLLDAIREDPTAVFSVEVDLPSGNRMDAKVGPMVNGRLVVNIGFDKQPPTDADIHLAERVMSQLMGSEPDYMDVHTGAEEHARAKVIAEAYLRGESGEPN